MRTEDEKWNAERGERMMKGRRATMNDRHEGKTARRGVTSIILVYLLSLFTLHTALAQIPADHDALARGDEMPQSKTLDSYGYLNPNNALARSAELRLTEEQKRSLTTIAGEMRSRAMDLGQRIIGIEKELDEAMRTGMVSEKSISDDSEQIGRLRGRLRSVFLTARLKTRAVLTGTQLELLRKSPSGAEKKAPK